MLEKTQKTNGMKRLYHYFCLHLQRLCLIIVLKGNEKNEDCSSFGCFFECS